LINTSTEPAAHRKTDAGISFSGHETFVFRYGWLKKAVDATLLDAAIFASDSAMVELGVGKNMVRSIRHWALATRALEEVPKTRGAQLQVSEFGTLLFAPGGFDKYLEDPNSLWLLHWNLATNERRATTWSWAFSLLTTEFTRDTLVSTMLAELNRRALPPPSEHSLRRDIDCFIRTYAPSRNPKTATLEDSLDCPFVELGLLEDDGASGVLRFKRGVQRTLAPEIFAYALIDYWGRVAHDRETLPFSTIAYRFGSPGTIFKLDENSLIERLERLEETTAGRLVYAETAGLKQVYRRTEIRAFELLSHYYETSIEAGV